MVCYDMVWYSIVAKKMVWYGMVANDHGMVWYDVAWYGMVWMQTDHGKLPLHPRATQVLRPNPPTHHLTVNQWCRCTPAKNQPQTNDFRLRVGLHEMHLFFGALRGLQRFCIVAQGFNVLALMVDDGGGIQTFYLEQMNMKFQTHDWIIIQSFDLIGDN